MQKNLQARLRSQLGAQPPDDAHGVYLALRQGLEGYEHPTAAAASVDMPRNVLYGWIGLDDVNKFSQFFLHCLERSALIGTYAAHDDASILLREKSFWHNHVHPHIGSNDQQQRADGQARAAQHHGQGCGIPLLHAGEHAPPEIAHAGKQPPPPAHNPARTHPGGLIRCGLLMGLGAQQAGAHHGRCGQRNNHGNQHGSGENHRKFAEQSPHQPTHEQDRREHRHQRNGDGNDGKTHLASAAQGGAQGCFAHFQPPHDIFKHHNGVVHHKARGNRQGHERKIIQAVAAQIHDTKGRQQGNGSRHRRNGRGPAVA